MRSWAATGAAGWAAFALGLALGQGAPRPALAQVPVVGLDSVHGFDLAHNLAFGSDFLELRNDLFDFGLSLQAVAAFSAQDLAPLDALFLLVPYGANSHTEFSPAEITALHDFVAAGKGLVVLADAGGDSLVDALNAVVATWGVSFAADPTDPDGRSVTGIDTSHPVTTNVLEIVVDFQRPITFAGGAAAADLSAGSGSDDVIGVVDAPGPVVLLSDSSLWEVPGGDAHLDAGHNRRLLRNTVRWFLAIPVPALPRVATLALALTLAGAGGYWLFRRSRSG